MKPKDQFNIYEYRLHKDGTIKIDNTYICEVELVSTTPNGEEWSAFGYSVNDEKEDHRHFKSYEMGRRYEGDIMYLTQNNIEEARKRFVSYYEHSITYYARKQLDAKRWVDKIKRGNGSEQ